MIIWVRNIVLILFVLTIIYVTLSTLSRIRRRRQLNLDYKTSKPETSKDEFMSKGMRKYERSLRPKLFIFVYLFPLAVMLLLIYLAQYS